MLENNTFRMWMFIGAILVVAVLVGLLVKNYDELIFIIKGFFSYKIQKY